MSGRVPDSRGGFLGRALPALKVGSATLGKVHMRILAGIGAWLLGAATATAGSLLAVSLLGQGIADSPGQQLTAAAVNRALTREAQEVGRAGSQTADPPTPTPSVTRPAAPRPAVAPQAQTWATHSATPAASQPPAWPSPQAGGTVLTSPGGTVLAECWSAGAYLVSWSPTQGYQATGVIRGPAATARVIFESDANSVTMVVSCPHGAAGSPAASSYIHSDGGGTDE
jgi:hypothetical protein